MGTEVFMSDNDSHGGGGGSGSGGQEKSDDNVKIQKEALEYEEGAKDLDSDAQKVFSCWCFVNESSYNYMGYYKLYWCMETQVCETFINVFYRDLECLLKN